MLGERNMVVGKHIPLPHLNVIIFWSAEYRLLEQDEDIVDQELNPTYQ